MHEICNNLGFFLNVFFQKFAEFANNSLKKGVDFLDIMSDIEKFLFGPLDNGKCHLPSLGAHGAFL